MQLVGWQATYPARRQALPHGWSDRTQTEADEVQWMTDAWVEPQWPLQTVVEPWHPPAHKLEAMGAEWTGNRRTNTSTAPASAPSAKQNPEQESIASHQSVRKRSLHSNNTELSTKRWWRYWTSVRITIADPRQPLVDNPV